MFFADWLQRRENLSPSKVALVAAGIGYVWGAACQVGAV